MTDNQWRSLPAWVVLFLSVPCLGSLKAAAPITGTPVAPARTAEANLSKEAKAEAAAPVIVKPRLMPEPPPPPQLPLPKGAKPAREPKPAGVPGAALKPSPSPSANFQALLDNGASIPPDTNGAVGPNHLMVATNTQVRVLKRDGTVALTISLNGFWKGLGNFSAFDPKIVYDPYGQRFVLVALSGARSKDSAVLVAVSKTTDPTGDWSFSEFTADPQKKVWADYPSLGFNRTWVVIQTNMWNVPATPTADDVFNRSHVYALDKAALYASKPKKHTVISTAQFGGTQSPAMTYDKDLSTLYLVQTWNGDTGGKGYLRLYTVTGAIGAETLTPLDTFPESSETWAVSGANAPQKGSSHTIDTGAATMIRAVYRNKSLWAVHGVYTPASAPSLSTVQWWELGTEGTVKQRGRLRDTAGPLFAAYPSIAVNKNNDVLIGYSRFAKDSFAGAAYSFRASSDPAGTFRAPRGYREGLASYFKTFSGKVNRWGDYSSTMVDPLNDTDFWTIQEYAAMPVTTGEDRDRWGTWWAKVSPP